jgi:glycosyltransferase involved in cell wall biosynthesis
MSDKKPISVFIVEQRGSGGMIHYAYQMCTAMAKTGADITLVTSSDYELSNYPHNFTINKLLNLWPLTDQLLSIPPKNQFDAFFRKIYWTGRRGVRALRLITQWVKLTTYLAKERPDIIQFGATEFPFEVIFLRSLKRKGLILSQICHEFEPRDTEKNILTSLNNQFFFNILQTFSVIFLHGEANRKRFLELFNIPQERIHLIPLGNEQIFQMSNESGEFSKTLRTKYGFSSSDKVVLFFGHITPSKGVSDLLEAFKVVHTQDKQVRLLIAGMPLRDIDMNNLFNLTTSLGISESTIFDTRYLPMEEVGPLMNLATVVAYPYVNSTQSAALQTAYAFGKPVISTNVGGLPEAVDNGKSGFLVPPNSPEALGKAILKITNDSHLATKMGKYAYHLSQTRFAWEPIAKQILDTYEEALYEINS